MGNVCSALCGSKDIDDSVESFKDRNDEIGMNDFENNRKKKKFMKISKNQLEAHQQKRSIERSKKALLVILANHQTQNFQQKESQLKTLISLNL